MSYIVKRRNTFLAPSASTRDANGHHLHVVCTEPCKSNKSVVLTISTIRDKQWHDPTVIIDVGLHKFVKAKSFVHYAYAQVMDCSAISRDVDSWVFMPKEEMVESVVSAMLCGAHESEMTPKFVLDYIDSLDA
ncbi:hypothetical protein [Xanthobacter aminoxidans]|uniref:hypothetical protein n=1 Tax=Xanthobacter aminoxidans TaxID=186280 RepID=UPI003729DF4E